MTHSYNIMVLSGDGIGPEVTEQAVKVIDWLNQENYTDIKYQDGLIGGASIDAYNHPFTDETLEKCRDADAILLGAVGGPKWDDVDFDIRPEAGLLKIRKELDLFANLRPAIVFDALVDASSLKPEIVKGLDIMIIRELTGGIYFGEPRGIEDIGNGERRGINTQVYTTSEINRVAHVAFDLAKKRHNLVHSCEKANVMESGKLWREEVTKLHEAHYKDVELLHMYADNCAMQLLRDPHQFDVILTDNLFGDILSDQAAMLTGSLGMLPSASLGAIDDNGKRHALYEPVHGSAPDIAGQGKANPLATILSLSMMFRYSFDSSTIANMIDDAVQTVLNSGLRTADVMADNCTEISTENMGLAVINEMKKLNKNPKTVSA